MNRKIETSESQTQKDRLLGYTREVACPACRGARLRPEILAVRMASENHGDLSIAGLAELSVAEAAEFLSGLVLGPREQLIAGAVLKEIQARLQFLIDVGLTYLTLNRAAGTLSGGEAQRIRLATQIGSGLAGCSMCSTNHPLGCTSGITSGSSPPWNGCGTLVTR